jgi:hypothetical protein
MKAEAVELESKFEEALRDNSTVGGIFENVPLVLSFGSPF